MTRSELMTEEEYLTWEPVSTLLELLPYEVDAQLIRESEITHFDYRILAALSLAPDMRVRASDLAIRTHVTRPRMSQALGRLEERGYVSRARSEEDARATNVMLTSAGKDKLTQATPGHVATIRRFLLDPLSANQREQLRGIVGTVLKQLDPEGRVSLADPNHDARWY